MEFDSQNYLLSSENIKCSQRAKTSTRPVFKCYGSFLLSESQYVGVWRVWPCKFNNNLAAPIRRFCLQAFAKTQLAVYQCTWQNKKLKGTPSQLHLLCFLYTDPNSIPKQLVLLASCFDKWHLSSTQQPAKKELCQVYKWQENKTEKGRSKLGWETAHRTLFWVGGLGGAS